MDVADNEKVETPMLMTWQWTGQLMCDNYNDGEVDEKIRKCSGGDRGPDRSREVESQPRSLQDD